MRRSCASSPKPSTSDNARSFSAGSGGLGKSGPCYCPPVGLPRAQPGRSKVELPSDGRVPPVAERSGLTERSGRRRAADRSRKTCCGFSRLEAFTKRQAI